MKRPAILLALLIAALVGSDPAEAQNQAPPQRPYSCRLYDDARRQCAFGNCDQRRIDRLERECLRDGGRP